MFAELIFVVLAFIGLLVIDTIYTPIALVACVFIIRLYVYSFSHISFTNLLAVFLITKIWGVVKFCLGIGRQLVYFVKTVFLSNKTSDCSTSGSAQGKHCGKYVCLENEIDTIVLKISKYYLHSWYDKISDNEEFVLYLNSAIKETLIRLCTSISRIDRKKVSYVFLQIYLHFFTHFINAKKKSEKFKTKHFEMRHWAMRDSMTEWCYLQSLVSALLDTFGPSEYHSSFHSKCNPLLHTVVVEILTEHVMNPLLNILSDPSYLNLWLLKLLLNSAKINGHFIEDSVIKENLPKDACSEDTQRLKPEILLSYDNSEIGCADEDVPSKISENMLAVPGECNSSVDGFRLKENALEFYVDDFHDTKEFENRSFVPSAVKSSSNINLLESNFEKLRTSSAESSSSVSCDISTIKRSRSADYIRQMPQLKALNEKDYNITLQSENNKMLVALKPDANSSSFIEQAEEAVEVEVPTLFSDVKITDTLQQNEAGLLPYTLYCIQYSGVFHDTAKSSETPHFVKQVVSIKRRFREFLALQSRLEDNPSLKNCLKGIKGPSKWLALPFSNLDKKNIAERKIFLENYLKELCGQGPITQSPELQEFLAYGGDSRMAFVKKNSDINVPRIDKMLYRGVKGAIDMFRTAIPNSPVEGGETPASFPKASLEDTSSEHRFQEHLLEFSSREPEIRACITKCVKTFLDNPFDDIDESWQKENGVFKKTSLLRHIHNLNAEECCRCSGTWDMNDENFMQENPFGNTIIELIEEVSELREWNYLFSLIKPLYASYIDRFIVNKLESISEEFVAVLLHLLHKTLWPDEKHSEETISKTTANLSKIREYLDVLLATKYVMLNVGQVRKFLLEKIYLFLLSFQHQQLNRCLLLHVFDVVIENVCSKEK